MSDCYFVYAVVYHWYMGPWDERTTLHSLHKSLAGALTELRELAENDYGVKMGEDDDRFSLPRESDEQGWYDIEKEEVYA